MRALWHFLKRTVLWDHDRGSVPYDLMCLVIVLFILLTPREMFNDRPLEFSPAREVVLLERETSTGLNVYRVQALLLAHDPRARAEELLHKKLRKKFVIARIEPVTDEDGAVLWYDVAVKE